MFQVQAPASEHQIAQSLRHVPHPVHFNPAHFASPQLRFRLRGRYLLRSGRDATAPPENFDTKPRSSHCYEVHSDKRFGKRRQRAHRRRFARPPRFLNRAGLKSRGRRELVRNTAWLVSRNRNDSAPVRENPLRACKNRQWLSHPSARF